MSRAAVVLAVLTAVAALAAARDCAGDVVLSTAAEVANATDCETVEGSLDLFVGATLPLLRSVGKDLTVAPCGAGQADLPALTTVGRSVSLNLYPIFKVVLLPALRSVKRNFKLELGNVRGMDDVTVDIGALQFVGKQLEVICSLGAKTSWPFPLFLGSLSSVSQILLQKIGDVSFPVLTSVPSLEASYCGDITCNSLTTVGQLSLSSTGNVSFPLLESAEQIWVSYPTVVMHTLEFPSLVDVCCSTCYFQFRGSNVTSLSVPKLQCVGSLIISEADALRSFYAPALEVVSLQNPGSSSESNAGPEDWANLEILDCMELSSVNLNSLQSVDGTLSLVNTSMVNLASFNSVTHVWGIRIQLNSLLKSFAGLDSLVNVEVNFHVFENPVLSDISLLNQQLRVGGNATFDDDPALCCSAIAKFAYHVQGTIFTDGTCDSSC
eukprot:TRINITY_DN182_c0_g1_i10.p1 TRINITY_DN182_c0_g1~~TRINITY_DN182_c0_g1_i10.p1  ORF type:complete len:438 (-),score=110.67 TRINITY_DN182_c0_g1_i10:298-1611(-)